jgi:hypothetical protein
MQTLQGNYAQNFSEQQGVLANLNETLQPVVNAGPSQTGFSAQESAALNTQALDTTGGNYANALRATQGQLAGRNDSGNLPESGVDQGIKARLASSAAGELSQEELGITEANYATGRSNFNSAVGAEEGIAGQYNPVSTGGLAEEANKNAFGEATQINEENNQADADIAGGVTSLAKSALSFGLGGFGNLDQTGGSSGGEQVGNFFSGGINALAGG